MKRIRVMTYNVHRCCGRDGRIEPERIARVIENHEPDIVALQELDTRRKRTQRLDQPHIIAKHLQMNYQFHPIINVKEGKSGNAILSRFPIKIIKIDSLPCSSLLPHIKTRGAIWAVINVDGVLLQLINTHLSVWPREQLKQAKHLLGPKWLTHPDCTKPVVFCGDFNASPGNPTYRHIKAMFRDAQQEVKSHRPETTWIGHLPNRRIDHVFVGPDINVRKAKVSKTNLDKTASDHLPLIIDLEIANENFSE